MNDNEEMGKNREPGNILKTTAFFHTAYKRVHYGSKGDCKGSQLLRRQRFIWETRCFQKLKINKKQ